MRWVKHLDLFWGKGALDFVSTDQESDAVDGDINGEEVWMTEVIIEVVMRH